MPNKKIEPRLEEEIQRVEAAGDTNRKIPVVIEHIAKPEIPPSRERTSRLDKMDQQVRVLQQGIVQHLSELGVTADIHQSTLSNSLSARLTAAQIKEIANRTDVKFITLSREERVTA